MTHELLWLMLAMLAVMAVLALAWAVATRSPRRHDDLDRALAEVQTTLAVRDDGICAQVSELDSKLASLRETVTSREAVLEEQIRVIGARVGDITGLFANDRARGGWGEISMLRIFELGGLIEDLDYTVQFDAGDRKPDAVVHLPGDRNIVVDAKFPMARYNEALATDDPEERRRLLSEQGKDLERAGKSLLERGYADLASGGYVLMYLPSQAVYESAAAAHPEVIERLLASRVVVAGPATLYALLMNVASLVTEHRALQQADRILAEARELHGRITVFVGHLQSVGTGLARTVSAFNGAVGSWMSRVAPQLIRVGELSGSEEHQPPEPIDEPVRELQMTGYQPG